MPTEFNHWPSGARDTTEFPKIDVSFDTSIREHLDAFVKMDNVGWTDYDAMNAASGAAMTGSRLRTYRKMYEKYGLISRRDDKIRVSHLGHQIATMECELNSKKEQVLDRLRKTAVEILSRYQLKNPADNDPLPEDCDVFPAICFWTAMRALDNKLHPEEVNRVIMWVMKMDDLGAAIERLKAAREALNGVYTSASFDILDGTLGPAVHTEQVQARIAPWFSFLGWGGLIIEQNVDDNGYRHLTDNSLDFIDQVLAQPPQFYETSDENDWQSHYIGEPLNVTEADNEAEGGDYLPVVFNTGMSVALERNRIVFGAPGTGKSFLLKRDSERVLSGSTGSFERVTFHPDYTYSQFVGTYKPVSDGSIIRYEFVPGPFMRVYVDALKSGRTNSPQPHILIIEEINRAKVASVFGDIFQLLDRDDDGVSEYEIQTSEDIRKYLYKELGGRQEDYARIKIPNNMFIWATMNSADQGVFPMDTAFKRRWNFEYLGINQNDSQVRGSIMLGTSVTQDVEWNVLRKAINEKLAKEYRVNEDKLMGPFFLSKKVLRTVSETDDTIADTDRFIETFKSKVIMYLYEDAAKQHKHKLFSGCSDTTKYSAVCDAFDDIGIRIFGDDFVEAYYNPQKG